MTKFSYSTTITKDDIWNRISTWKNTTWSSFDNESHSNEPVWMLSIIIMYVYRYPRNTTKQTPIYHSNTKTYVYVEYIPVYDTFYRQDLLQISFSFFTPLDLRGDLHWWGVTSLFVNLFNFHFFNCTQWVSFIPRKPVYMHSDNLGMHL